MDIRPFVNQTEKPTDVNIENSLGKSYKFYLELEKLTNSFKREWNYSKNSGWMQKVFDQKKALFYLVPLVDSFKISLTVRENERISFLKDKLLKGIHPQLVDTKKYSEGFAVHFLITDRTSYLQCSSLIKKIIDQRS